MRLPWRRRPASPPPRPNQTAIAVLEHDLLGIKPEPGSLAAAAVALRRTGTCLNHEVTDVTRIADPAPVGLCTRCGRNFVQDEHRSWTVA